MSKVTNEESFELLEKTGRLLGQWPKKCSCGNVYGPQEWLRLRHAYFAKDAYSTQEGRHCPACGTTLVIDLEIHDLSEE